jgi:hypothetical protein
MRSVRCPGSLWSHCTWCHLTGWSLIPPATPLASRRSRCLLNQISSTSAICPWSLRPTAAMARCLLMKKNTTRTFFENKEQRFSCFILLCTPRQALTTESNLFSSLSYYCTKDKQPTYQHNSSTTLTHNLMHPNYSQINLAKQYQNT